MATTPTPSPIVRPYDGRSGFPIDDETIAAVSNAIAQRSQAEQDRLEAFSNSNSELTNTFSVLVASQLNISRDRGEAEFNALFQAVSRAVAADKPITPVLTRLNLRNTGSPHT